MWLLYIIGGIFIGGWYVLYLVIEEASSTLVKREDQDIKDMEEYHKHVKRK